MSTIKSSNEHLTFNADGSSKDIKFQANGVEKASISSAGAFTSTTIDATKLTGTVPNGSFPAALPAISGANLTDLPPSGGSVTATADGAISANQSVVLQSNGKVKAVTGSTVAENFSLSSATQPYGTEGRDVIGYALDRHNAGKGIIMRRDGSSIKFFVFTTSGTTISYGSEQSYSVGSNFRNDNLGVSYCASNKVVFCYIKNGDSQNSSTNACACVATISGTTMSFGSESVVNNGYSNGQTLVCDQSIDDRVATTYLDGAGGYQLRMKAGTISGTSISWSGAVTITSGNADGWCMDYNDNRYVLVLKDHANGYVGRAIAMSINGNSVSAGSMVTFDSTTHANHSKVAINPNNNDEFLICNRVKNDNYPQVMLGSISGNTCSFGSFSTVVSRNVDNPVIRWNKNSEDKFILWYADEDKTIADGRVEFYVGTLSGSSWSFGSPIILTQTASHHGGMNIAFDQRTDGADKFYYLYYDSGSDTTHRIGQMGGATSTNLTATNFLGFSDAAYSDTATATVLVNSAISTQSSLTPLTKYYVQTNGTLGTSAATPSVLAGTAIASTKLLIKEEL
jgi:hypothetical protein